MFNLSDNIERKFVDTIELDEGWEIETDTGFEPITHIGKTIEYEVYNLILEDNIKLDCADTHIVFDENLQEIFVKDLKTGQKIHTKYGLKSVINVLANPRKEHMFDLSVKHENNRFYTNDILSHNSTICAAYYVWSIIFQRNCKVAMLANKESISKDLLNRVKLAIEHLPLFLKPQILKWDQTSIKLANGSEVIAAATSASAIRGMAISILHIDEMAFIPNNIVEDFFLSVYPTISSGKKTKCIIVSTPNGFNYYHKLWKGAETGKNGFTPIAVDWWEVPGRDETWKRLKIAEIGDVKFAQEYSCVFGDTFITLKHKETGQIHHIKIEEAYKLIDILNPSMEPVVIE